jgi:hypothetical protein
LLGADFEAEVGRRRVAVTKDPSGKADRGIGGKVASLTMALLN